jgi:hypothetical protein
MRGSVRYSTSSGMAWGAELVFIFFCGFLLATVLWLGLWFFWRRPAQAAALQANEGVLKAKDSALLKCVAAKDQGDKLKDELQAQNKRIDTKLKEALKRWGGCLRSKTAPDAQENPNPSQP